MSKEITLYFAQPKAFDQRGALEQIFALFDTLGYAISDVTVGYSAEQFVNYDTDVETATWHAHTIKTIWFFAPHEENDLELDIVVDWSKREKEPFIRIFTDQLMLFIGSDYHSDIDRAAYQVALLTLGKELYRITHPTFGLIDGGSTEIAPSKPELESLALPHLYWANFFGPNCVEKIGREKLLHAPIGLVEEFTDGGVLYRLDRDLIGPNVTDRKREQMLRYFGL